MAERKKRGDRGQGGTRYLKDKKLWEGRLVTGVNPGTGKDIRMA